MRLTEKQSDKLAWGTVLIVFGVLILLHKTGITDHLPVAGFLRSPGTYILTAGIIFLIFRKDKTLGIVLTVIGAIVHSDIFFGWMHDYRQLILPMVLIVVGLVLILKARRK